jgi:hypothetical protein
MYSFQQSIPQESPVSKRQDRPTTNGHEAVDATIDEEFSKVLTNSKSMSHIMMIKPICSLLK